MAYIRPKHLPDRQIALPVKLPTAHPRTMSNLPKKRGRVKIEWQRDVVHPVNEALEKTITNRDNLADALHVTNFILKGLEQEMEEMIEHVAYAKEPKDFASMIILASAAPKFVYDTMCQKIHAFVRSMAKANSLAEERKAAIEEYFVWLRQNPSKQSGEHPATRLSLMFIRDAAYMSSPSNIQQLVDLGTDLKKSVIEHQLKLVTLAMCGDALGTPVPAISDMKDMKDFLPCLARSITLCSDRGCIRRGDYISETPATKHSLDERKDQILKFLRSFRSKL